MTVRRLRRLLRLLIWRSSAVKGVGAGKLDTMEIIANTGYSRVPAGSAQCVRPECAAATALRDVVDLTVAFTWTTCASVSKAGPAVTAWQTLGLGRFAPFALCMAATANVPDVTLMCPRWHHHPPQRNVLARLPAGIPVGKGIRRHPLPP